MKITWLLLMPVLTLGLIVGGCAAGGEDEPTLRITNLRVAGMTCESCEAAIVETVGRMDGVQLVEARHDPGEATVGFDPSVVSIEAISEAIEGMGYTVVSSSGSEPDASS